MKPKYLITNLVYGATYAKLFCDNHLQSVLDPTNLPALAEHYDIEYQIFTDEPTSRTLSMHPNVTRLSKIVTLTSQRFGWPDTGVNRFSLRYGLLLNVFNESVRKAIADQALLTCWVADLVVAKHFFSRVFAKITQGHGAVFVLPLRAASEAVTPVLMAKPDALNDLELCALGLECMHPLWVACHWDNPQFTKLPFTMLWQGQGGVLARSFSTTPIVFKPNEAMLSSRGMIDGDIPALCENPYWALDWTEAPVIGVEPLICYYPPFANRPASTGMVADWALNIQASQIPYIEHQMYYPNKASVTIKPDTLLQSNHVVSQIINRDSLVAANE